MRVVINLKCLIVKKLSTNLRDILSQTSDVPKVPTYSYKDQRFRAVKASAFFP